MAAKAGRKFGCVMQWMIGVAAKAGCKFGCVMRRMIGVIGHTLGQEFAE